MTNIHCINPQCDTLNPVSEMYCSNCQTPVIKRYLRVLGDFSPFPQNKALGGGRFSPHQGKIVLDTQPHLTPPAPSDLSDDIVSYLKLFSYRLHTPQVYAGIEEEGQVIWLLEYEGIMLDENTGKPIYEELFCSFLEIWSKASPFTQVNLLWQMIHLWHPLSKQQMLSSLLDINNLAVSGNFVKLIELKSDQDFLFNLGNLASLWHTLLPKINPILKEIINKIILSLEQGLLTKPEQVISIFDQIIHIISNNNYIHKYEIIATTNAGKKREKNEDACYPQPDIIKESGAGINSLTIVCDGLGGQKGGEIASRLAIDTLEQELNKAYEKKLKETLHNQNWTPLIDKRKIVMALSKANNRIAKINNANNSKERDRMGTTVVLTMAIDHEIYLAHVGDSRIYLISNSSGCHQVTVDDDLASREVRLGYSLYREAIATPQTGALIQALGTDYASRIRPHIKRLIMNEDCIFLLCSDGLSDYERVEQYWQKEMLPILRGDITLEEGLQSLLNLALEKNGHDNITIALVRCGVTPVKDAPPIKNLTWEYLTSIIPNLPQPSKKSLSISANLIHHQYFWLALLIITILGLGALRYRQGRPSPSNNQSSLSYSEESQTLFRNSNFL
ncbi:MAG: protein phosphatase 2C domain-containing protein [Cyanobacterium sp. T60_A2020_053]|nr:protein phosphatase 2C domain-containing protein [Cyanobacterium sp. T60_A2020_053]